MLKGIFSSAKNCANQIAISKAKTAMINAATNAGMDMDDLMTPAIDAKFNELAELIIEEHGLVKLGKIGLEVTGVK